MTSIVAELASLERSHRVGLPGPVLFHLDGQLLAIRSDVFVRLAVVHVHHRDAGPDQEACGPPLGVRSPRPRLRQAVPSSSIHVLLDSGWGT